MPTAPIDFEVSVPAARGDAVVSARHYPASAAALEAVLVLAHGASAGQDSPFMVSYARGIADRGLAVITFNFPYMEQGRKVAAKASDRVDCWRAVAGAARDRTGAPLLAGGKSMGGRVASMLASESGPGDPPLAGLVFLGYPLHPPGRGDQPRVSHWRNITPPALFVLGARDAFGSPDELREHLPSFGGKTELLVVDGGDHSFKVSRGPKGRQQQVHDDIHDAIVSWARRTVAV